MSFKITEATYERSLQIGSALEGCKTLDEVQAALMVEFPDWTVYRGGNHIALHKFSGALRTALITEAKA